MHLHMIEWRLPVTSGWHVASEPGLPLVPDDALSEPLSPFQYLGERTGRDGESLAKTSPMEERVLEINQSKPIEPAGQRCYISCSLALF